MKLGLAYWPESGISVEHGPLVYSLPIKENWTPVVERDFSTEEFPSWNATPASAWNYGIDIQPETLASTRSEKAHDDRSMGLSACHSYHSGKED